MSSLRRNVAVGATIVTLGVFLLIAAAVSNPSGSGTQQPIDAVAESPSPTATPETHVIADGIESGQRQTHDWPCFPDRETYGEWMNATYSQPVEEGIEDKDALWLEPGDHVEVLQHPHSMSDPDKLRITYAPETGYAGLTCWADDIQGYMFSS